MEYRSVAISSLFLFGAGLATSASAATVNSFASSASNGVWHESDMRGGGQASIVSLAGAGGNLENNQPLPVGAARLTTGASNNDKAEVGVEDAYGNARGVFEDTFSLSYSYFKEDVGNAFSAPSIKLELNASSFVCIFSDCNGTLIYEPYWNQSNPGTAQLVPTGDWQSVTITADSGLFWWSGGFGVSSDLEEFKTLSGWMDVFNGNFEDADLVALSMGVGTYNQSVDTFFDDVSISTANGYSAYYDFEPAVVPIPAAAWLFGSAMLGLFGIARRKKA